MVITNYVPEANMN